MTFDISDILWTIGLMLFVYMALTKLSVYVREREIRRFKEGKGMRWARRKWKQGYFAPPKSFKPVDLPGLKITNMAIVARAVLENADDEPMQDHEVELLNKVVQPFHKEPMELPEADIKLAIVVMQKYSHLLDDLPQVMLKALSRWQTEKEA